MRAVYAREVGALAGRIRNAVAAEAKVVRGQYPVTPDGRYFVVRGRLWRCANPGLGEGRREALVKALMAARSAKGKAMRAGDADAREAARQRVDTAKVALGERGAVWWNDGAPDENRTMAKNSSYAAWWAAIEAKGTD